MADFQDPEDAGNNVSSNEAENWQLPVEDAGTPTNSAAVSNGSTNDSTTAGHNAQPAANGQGGNNPGSAGGDGDNDPPVPPRHLRLRDFNPYSVKQRLAEQQFIDKKGKKKMDWREPYVVTERSTMDVKGIFKHDITSWLPYVEVVSEETFEVTDVMMDDCRLLLLRVGISCVSPSLRC
jgi:hypothetical protein